MRRPPPSQPTTRPAATSRRSYAAPPPLRPCWRRACDPLGYDRELLPAAGLTSSPLISLRDSSSPADGCRPFAVHPPPRAAAYAAPPPLRSGSTPPATPSATTVSCCRRCGRVPGGPPGFVRNCVSNYARASQALCNAVSNGACPDVVRRRLVTA